MQCRSVLLRLDEFRTGELAAGETATIENHLETCSWCEDSLHELQSVASRVKELAGHVHGVPSHAAPDLTDQHGVVETSRGAFRVAFSARGITMISRAADSPKAFATAYAARYGKELREGAVPETYRRQIADAVEGHGPAHPEIDIADLPEFERKVLASLLAIPPGEVRPYAWVAREAGRPKAVRAVGNICAKNPVPFIVPCHRVVPSGGGVGNYGFGSAMKRELLDREGVAVGEIEEMRRKGTRYVGSRTTKIYCYPTCPDARRIREENRVPLRNERDAAEKGFRSCLRCRPQQLSA